MQLGESPERRELVKALAADALLKRGEGMTALEWMGVWYTPDCFAMSREMPDDEMNVAMGQVAGWVWGPARS